MRNLNFLLVVGLVLGSGGSAFAQVNFCKAPGQGLVLPINQYDCVKTKGELEDENEGMKSIRFDQLAPGSVGFVIQNIKGETTSYQDAEGSELFMHSFNDGASLEFPIGDVGVKSIVLSDTCSFGQVQKTVHTLLDPNEPLGFPLVDGRVNMTQIGASVKMEFLIPRIELQEGQKLTQEILDAAPYELYLEYQCSPRAESLESRN